VQAKPRSNDLVERRRLSVHTAPCGFFLSPLFVSGSNPVIEPKFSGCAVEVFFATVI
jgi:hypothetical protein